MKKNLGKKAENTNKLFNLTSTESLALHDEVVDTLNYIGVSTTLSDLDADKKRLDKEGIF